jgi:CO/xanthine dehydrogenase Mo-binding subunit
MQKWRKEMDSKLAALTVARQFLYGAEPENDHIRLIKWDSPVYMLWFRSRMKRQMNPFAEAMFEQAAALRQWRVPAGDEWFVRQERIRK